MLRIGQPHRNDYQAATRHISEFLFMYTQAPARQFNKKPAPTVFARRNDPEPSATFIAGECICKACDSANLRYIPYLEDAKCECGQYQNEPLLDS